MTLAQLKNKADILKIGGRVLPTNDKLEVFQEMVFDAIVQVCDPLNLAIPYQDSNIYRTIEDERSTKWFLRKPIVATEDTHYIDIDSRLELAFVYYLIAFLANDTDKVVFEQKGYRVCLEYAVDVLRVGLPRAKEVYEEERFITAVQFDCVGKFYEVDEAFMLMVIDCFLCGNVCMNASYKSQMERYSNYLENLSIKPIDLEPLRALDRAIFLHIMNNFVDYSAYSTDDLAKITTLSCEFEKIANGESVEPWVNEIDTRLFLAIKDN